MNDTEVQYLPISISMAGELNGCCLVVNDWATKKGWNGELTPEKKAINRKIAMFMLAIGHLCDDIERVRKDLQPDEITLQDVLAQFGETAATLTDEQCNDLAQFGLMTTEIAEAAEATIFGKEQDDHIPNVPAVLAEMADVLIRVFHFCGKRELNLGGAVAEKHRYNTRRPFMHGKKA